MKQINPKRYGMARINENGKFEFLNYKSDINMWSKETEQKDGNYRRKLISNRKAVKWWRKYSKEKYAELLPF